VQQTADEQYERLRSLCYTGADAVVILFSLQNRETFDHVKPHWSFEVKHFCPAAPVLVIGTKSDLRVDGAPTIQEGKLLATEIGAKGYFECSLKLDNQSIVDALVENALREVTIAENRRKKPICNLM